MTLAAKMKSDYIPDYTVIKAKQQAVWDSGDYGRIGTTLQITGEQLCEAMDLRAGETVLDVAAGNGNASLAAARRFCKVVSSDYVPALLAHSAERARAEKLTIDYQHADAEDLPFEDQQFNNVMSTFGVMFTPNQKAAAAEMIRVCKQGGKIGLANWTPDGFIGQLFKTIGRYVPPPPGVSSPAAWATNEFLQSHFEPHAADIQVNSHWFVFRYQSPQHWLAVFGTYYGPTLKAFETLEAQQRDLLQQEILDLIDRFNRAEDGTMVVPSRYAEIVITRQ